MKIYKLVNEDGLTYIGKTNCKYLSSRLSVHKSQALTERNIKKCTSEKLFRNNKKVKIELLEITDDKQREAYYIEKFDCVNQIKSGLPYVVTKKNWLIKNPNYYKNYYDKNKPNSKKYTCECGAIICKGSKGRHEKTNNHKNSIIYNKWFSVISNVLTKNMDFQETSHII